MSEIEYNGEHAITFLEYDKNTLDILSYKRSWVDFHLIPDKRPSVPFTKPSYTLVDVPGTNKTIDITSYMITAGTHERRTGQWNFVVDHSKWNSWYEAKREIESYINGKRLYCVLEDNRDVVYDGRFTISNWQNGAAYSSVTINYELFNEEKENDFHYPRKVLSEDFIQGDFSAVPRHIASPEYDEQAEQIIRDNAVVKIVYDDGDYDICDWYEIQGYDDEKIEQELTAYVYGFDYQGACDDTINIDIIGRKYMLIQNDQVLIATTSRRYDERFPYELDINPDEANSNYKRLIYVHKGATGLDLLARQFKLNVGYNLKVGYPQVPTIGWYYISGTVVDHTYARDDSEQEPYGEISFICDVFLVPNDFEL